MVSGDSEIDRGREGGFAKSPTRSESLKVCDTFGESGDIRPGF